MGLSVGGNKQKSKQTTTQNQQFNQTQNTALSDRAYSAFTDRMGELKGQQYQTLDPNAYKAYENPYQQDVINAATADINANRDLAANQQMSDIAAAGAFGDKRRGIQEAALQGEYDRTLATTLAGLRSQGFQRAQDVAVRENGDRNNYSQQTQAMINQLLAMLGNETTTTGSGTSSGTSTSKGKSTGLNFGFTYGGS